MQEQVTGTVEGEVVVGNGEGEATAPKAKRAPAKRAQRTVKGATRKADAEATTPEAGGLTKQQLQAIAEGEANNAYLGGGTRQLPPTTIVGIGRPPAKRLAGHNGRALTAYVNYLQGCRNKQTQASNLQAMQAALKVKPTNVGYMVQKGWLVEVATAK